MPYLEIIGIGLGVTVGAWAVCRYLLVGSGETIPEVNEPGQVAHTARKDLLVFFSKLAERRRHRIVYLTDLLKAHDIPVDPYPTNNEDGLDNE